MGKTYLDWSAFSVELLQNIRSVEDGMRHACTAFCRICARKSLRILPPDCHGRDDLHTCMTCAPHVYSDRQSSYPGSRKVGCGWNSVSLSEICTEVAFFRRQFRASIVDVALVKGSSGWLRVVSIVNRLVRSIYQHTMIQPPKLSQGLIN